MWDIIPPNFKKPETEAGFDFFDTWKSFADWKKRFIAHDLQTEELTERFSVKSSRVTKFVFGWHREKAQMDNKSICHHLLKYIGGFVTICLDNSIEPPVHAAEWAKIMGTVKPLAEIGLDRRFSLPFLFRIMEAPTRVGHGIGSAQHGLKAPRVVNAAIFQSTEANELMVSFAGKKISGDGFTRLVFGLTLSGYQPTIMYDNIQRMGDELLKGKDFPLTNYITAWLTRPNFLGPTNIFLGK